MSDLKTLDWFTCNSPEGSYTLYLGRGPDHNSREASGVWVFNGEAWKIFPNMNQWDRVHNDYDKATHHQLSTPTFRLVQGTVTDHRKLVKDGFALVTTYITSPSKFFTLKKDVKTVKNLIRSITDHTVLSQIERAFAIAIDMNVQDPQGFIDQCGSPPIMFIDLHTHTTPAGSLFEIYGYVRSQRATLQQRR